MKRTSKNYVMTIDVESCVDYELVETVRKSVAIMNQTSDVKHRVVLRGRRPIEKKVIHAGYYMSGERPLRLLSYDYYGNIVGGIQNASEIDVYIYRA